MHICIFIHTYIYVYSIEISIIKNLFLFLVLFLCSVFRYLFIKINWFSSVFLKPILKYEIDQKFFYFLKQIKTITLCIYKKINFNIYFKFL